MVYCNIASAELQQLGLETEFAPLPIDCSNPKVWEGVRCNASLPACFPVVQDSKCSSYCSCCLRRQWCSTRHSLMSTQCREGLLCLPGQALLLACRNRYWQLDTYMLPVCTLAMTTADNRALAAD